MPKYPSKTLYLCGFIKRANKKFCQQSQFGRKLRTQWKHLKLQFWQVLHSNLPLWIIISDTSISLSRYCISTDLKSLTHHKSLIFPYIVLVGTKQPLVKYYVVFQSPQLLLLLKYKIWDFCFCWKFLTLLLTFQRKFCCSKTRITEQKEIMRYYSLSRREGVLCTASYSTDLSIWKHGFDFH